MKRARILIVEDEAIVAEDLERAITDMGYEVVGHAGSAKAAVKKALELKPDLILMDIVLVGERNGIDASYEIKEKMDIPIIFLTAYSDLGLIDKAKSIEPYAYIVKPFQERQLYASIEMALYRSRIEKRLKESEEWLSTTLHSIGDAVIATNIEGYVKFMNPVAEALTGWKQEDAIGKPLKDVFNIVSEETGEHAVDPVTRIVREGVVARLANHTILIAKDGTEIPIDDSGSPIRDDKGEIIGVVLVFRDITERKEAEEAVRESEEKLSQIIQGSSMPSFVIDNNYIVTHWNKACENLTGISANEVVGTQKQWTAFYPVERPVMADLIVGNAPEEEIARHYGSKYRKSTLIDSAYEAESFFPHLTEGGNGFSLPQHH